MNIGFIFLTFLNLLQPNVMVSEKFCEKERKNLKKVFKGFFFFLIFIFFKKKF